MKIYSKMPEVVGNFKLNPEEFCYHVYMPIKCDQLYLPESLHWTKPLLFAIRPEDYRFKFWYLTVKYMWIEGYGNREGWHIDGFGSDDINYIWSDCNPTEFCVQEFDLTEDHLVSLYEMEQQALPENCIRVRNNDFLRLTPDVVHRPVKVNEPTLRAFVKVSCSNNRYNLKGNSSNPELPYKFIERYVERGLCRNHPVGGENEQ